MKRGIKSIIAITMLAAVFMLSGCGKEKMKNPKLTDNPKMFYEAWDKAALDNIDTKDIRWKLAAAFPEELNMETHAGLIQPEDFTGPILCFRSDESDNRFNRIFIPEEKIQDYLKAPKFPDDIEIAEYTYSAERIPDEYLSDDKLTKLQKKKQPVVFAFVECTGYTEGAVYVSPSGNKEAIYQLGWRVSFYSYPDCTLLGWETVERAYAKPESMSYDRTYLDQNKKRVYIYDSNGAAVDVMAETMKLLYGDSYGQSDIADQPVQPDNANANFIYDDNGKIIREEIMDDNGELSEYIEYAYHIDGFVVTKTGYDKNNVKRWHAILRSDGSYTSYSTYYSSGNLESVTDYDENGNVIKTTNYEEDPRLLD
jgi:hypothetical protein